MLKILSQYVYFLLVALCIAILVMLSLSQASPKVWPDIVLLYTVVLLPFFSYLIDSFRGETNIPRFWLTTEDIVKYVGIVIIIIFSYYKGYHVTHVLLFLFLYVSIFWKLDSRIAFFWALLIFFYIPIYLIAGNSIVAESLSIYAYYFLIIGVVVQIQQALFSKKQALWRK